MREAVSPDPEIRDEVQRKAAPFLALLDTLFEEGRRKGLFRPLRTDPMHFLSVIAGTTLFYVGALPTLIPTYDPHKEGEAGIALLQENLCLITRRLLGIAEPAGMAKRPDDMDAG